jgi:hypothetical protein
MREVKSKSEIGRVTEIQGHAIEMHSEDGEVPQNTKVWLEKMGDGAKTFGKVIKVGETVKYFVAGAGYENV